MATGKERGFKDWKGSKEFRRSARNYTESETVGKGKKKNTRKWCKGKVGRKHVLGLFNKYTWRHGYKCINCGREFLWHFSDPNRDKFDYVPVSWDDPRAN
ncbi:hypothetical protein SEA_YABOI_200 [Streptomyces phage Yaboi]|jgi:hypothetical protein|uniref:Uncharacterized protein n=3 Tax=Streptomyces virus Yaboi TaxID=2846408 RepID=A0A385ULT3_9CAUD|nr:hypothetical protein [Streptomyces sp. JV178]YP_009841296.1 hypothetical protein HWB86_gp122 [Streptomyces phage Yaboi]QAY08821.1 hypothetical protein SEA_GENIE2_195 [Streptomyces phage Genie2]QAY12811.1 hypothetical protein SEA_BOOMERJR_195 [Streptomyces phage BoomerJR]UVD40005.1 hypothetical protein SEA_STANIMAL_195 [Streptomyces phage Stanimal]WNM73747.1 hypothetical protein SEA_SOLLERTIA_196 [Streptomyces phage Sollertia]AYB70997.1 hypothetical protein SEA_YABOI_200 [Streptomyces phage